MQKLLLLVCLFSSLVVQSQLDKKYFTGEWKNYLADSITFEYLRLNEDGTGLKCFGQTWDGEDSLFYGHITTLAIDNWRVENDKLIIQTRDRLSFNINPYHQVKKVDDSSFAMMGEHLNVGIHPSP